MERINVRLEGRLKRELETEAREKGVKPSEIVRQVLEQHIRERAVASDARQLAEQIGFLGCVGGLPGDLSTNKHHFTGFGRD